MNAKTWDRRLAKLAFADPIDHARHMSQDEMMRRLSPGEREELADLREQLDAGGLEGLTDAELERLRQLATILHGDSPADGSGAR